VKRRLVLFLGAFEALLVLVAVYFEPGYGVRGLLWGEAFFEGRSTSYWNHELEHWQVFSIDWGFLVDPPQELTLRSFQREPSTLDRWRARYFPNKVAVYASYSGPRILRGGEAARPVLEELLKVGSPKVCGLARIGLGNDLNLQQVDNPEAMGILVR
jgi:hypothetical protein